MSFKIPSFGANEITNIRRGSVLYDSDVEFFVYSRQSEESLLFLKYEIVYIHIITKQETELSQGSHSMLYKLLFKTFFLRIQKHLYND